MTTASRVFLGQGVLGVLLAFVGACRLAAAEIAVADPSRPLPVVVWAPAEDRVCRQLAEVLARRLGARTGGRVPSLQAESPGSSPASAGGVVVRLGPPPVSGPRLGLWQGSSPGAGGLGDLGPGGYAVVPARDGGGVCVFLAAADHRGQAAAVGGFLRHLDFRDGGAWMSDEARIDRIDPAVVMQVQQYKPAQWGNPFKDAPIELMREYVEELALWGSDSFWNLCCYMIDNPFAPGADAASVAAWERVRDLFLYAHALGLGIGLVDCPNSVYDDQLHLRKLGGSFVYREDVCPSIPEVRKVLLENRENLYRAARDAGIDLKYLLHFAHDNGGCGCDACQPWIMTYLGLTEELHRLARRYHPEVKVFLTTWMLSAAEKRMMLEFVERERPEWLAGVMDRPGVRLPEGLLSSGWQTIMTYGTDRVYGRMGADPMPAYLHGKVKGFLDQGIRAIFTYSEGIYDDINTAAIAQIARHPRDFDAVAFLAEYARAYFGTDAAASARLADLIATEFTAVPYAHSAHVGVRRPQVVMAALQEIEAGLPAWGRESWRYGILKAKVDLECLSERAGSLDWWLPGVTASLAAAAQPGAAGGGREAVGAAARRLREVTAEFAACRQRVDAVTRHLYLELYQTPNRHPVHGSFALTLPWAALVAELTQRCEALSTEADAGRFGEGLAALRRRLPPVLEADRTVAVPPNLALRRPAAASSVYDPRFAPGKAVDGEAIVVYTSSENAWASKEGQPGPSWWQVDLGEPQAVREVRVWYR
ncbi:MAG: discoidin domain-containing protein, partial [Lentisphaerae bacterium]|nr:discoidin domain-containing protein [Lentisphaerota bacterium]